MSVAGTSQLNWVTCEPKSGSSVYTGLIGPNQTLVCVNGFPFGLAPQAPPATASGATRFGVKKGTWMAIITMFVFLSCIVVASDDFASTFRHDGEITLMRRDEKQDGSAANATLLSELGVNVISNLSDLKAQSITAGDKFIDKLTGILVIVESVSTANSNITKRVVQPNCPSRNYEITQVQVAQHGYWWSSWTQATSTVLCGQGGGGGINKDISWTIGYGISIDAGISIEDVISAMLGIGVSLEKSVTRGCSVSCECSTSNFDYQKACIWEQSRLSWSDTQKQSCDIYEDCNGTYKNCGAWSAYQRTNTPFKDAECTTDYQYGCSHDNGCG